MRGGIAIVGNSREHRARVDIRYVAANGIATVLGNPGSNELPRLYAGDT